LSLWSLPLSVPRRRRYYGPSISLSSSLCLSLSASLALKPSSPLLMPSLNLLAAAVWVVCRRRCSWCSSSSSSSHVWFCCPC
jgi:hypothetical protein